MKYLHKILLLSIFSGMTLFTCSCDKKEPENNLFLHAFFKANATKVTTGDTVHFEDYSIGHPNSWKWTFEGGSPSTSTEEDPIVTYDTPGQYDVTLTVSDKTESTSKVEENYVLVISKNATTEHVVASYSFDGSAADASPNHFNATKMGDVTFDGTDRYGNENSTAVFNGSDALIIPDNPEFNNIFANDFSISIWLKTNQKGRMMIWQEAGSDDGHSVNRQGYMRMGDKDAFVHVMFRNDNKIDRLKYFEENGSALSDGNWHNVVTTREGANCRLYVDGELKVDLLGATPQIDFSTGWDFKIGVQQNIGGGFGHYFIGYLDDLVIYDKALTEQEITDLFQQ